MSEIKPVTWNDDPSHFRRGRPRPLPRQLLQAARRGDRADRHDRAQGRIAHSHLPARRLCAPGIVGSASVRADRVSRPARDGRYGDHRRQIFAIHAKHGEDRGQDHGRPLDDPRRSGARARHAQYVHGLSSVAGDPISVDRRGGLARARLAQQPSAVRLRAEYAE